MGWGYGFENGRDVGYGVPAWCDHPDCTAEIDRGLAYVCGGMHGGDGIGCGLYFCEQHRIWKDDPNDDSRAVEVCERCAVVDADGYVVGPGFEPKPDHPDWLRWKLTDESWEPWRAEHPEQVEAMQEALNAA